MNKGGLNRLPGGVIQRIFLTLLFINVIYSKQGSGEGGGFAEGYQEGFVDLPLRFDEDTTEEEYQSSDGEHKGCYEL